jgi:pimeloyl-ACP methyl ester carboxylesterase
VKGLVRKECVRNYDGDDGIDSDNDVDWDGVELVALDFPGHGWSSHKSVDGTSNGIISEFVYYVAEAVTLLRWDSHYVIGHSMGGIVSLMYAAVFPRHVKRLVLLDSYGPEHRKPETVSTRIQRHVVQRFQNNQRRRRDQTDGKQMSRRRVYHSLQAAVDVRQQTARLSPGGHQWLSDEAAREMVKRSTKTEIDPSIIPQPAAPSHLNVKEAVRENGVCTPTCNKMPDDDESVQFIHDSRLKDHPLMVHVLEHNDVYWQRLKCTTLCLNANNGWPFPQQLVNRAYEQTSFVTVKNLPGSHHFHGDPESADEVLQTILEFFDDDLAS